MPLRIEIERNDLTVRRYKGRVYPTIRILTETGAIVAAPNDRTVIAIQEAYAVGKKVWANFKAGLSKADLAKADVRSTWVQKEVAIADGDAAIELYKGFAPNDGSDARFEALSKLVTFLTDVGRPDPSTKLLDEAEGIVELQSHAAEIQKLRLDVYVVKLKLAFAARNKAECMKILDDVAEKYPESEMGQKVPELKKQMEAQIGDPGSQFEWGGRRERGNRGRQPQQQGGGNENERGSPF